MKNYRCASYLLFIYKKNVCSNECFLQIEVYGDGVIWSLDPRVFINYILQSIYG